MKTQISVLFVFGGHHLNMSNVVNQKSIFSSSNGKVIDVVLLIRNDLFQPLGEIKGRLTSSAETHLCAMIC